MPVTLLDAEATAASANTVTLTLGANAQAGDRRLTRVTISSAATFGTTPDGWTKLSDEQVSGAGRTGLFERVVQEGDTGPWTLSLSAVTAYDRASITARGVHPSTVLSPAHNQVGGTSASPTAPSVPTDGSSGQLVTWHAVAYTSSASTASWPTDPAGMTRQATATTASATGLTVLLLSQASPPNPSGARTATASQAGAGTRATALFIPDPAAAAPAATLSGGGGISGSAAATRPAAATLSGGGSLSGNARTDRPAAATLSGGGGVSSSASATRTVAATLSGGGGIAASGGQVASATLTAGGGISGGAQQDHSASATLSAGGALTGAATQHHRGAAATLWAGGGLGAAGTRAQPAAATLSGGGAIVSTGTRVKIGSTVLSGGGAIVMGYVLRTAVVSAQLTAGGSMLARASAAAGGALNPTLWAVDPLTGRLRPLPHVVKLQVDDVDSDVGAVQVDYPVWGKNWELLRDYVSKERKLYVEVWLEGNRASRVVGRLDQRSGDDVAEGAVWSFSGTLIPARLGDGVIAPQPLVGETTLGPDVEVTKASVTSAQWSRFYALGYRTTDEANTKLTAPQKVVDAVKANAVAIPQLADPKREAKFSSATPGAILLFLLQQCWGRGALADLTVDFTASRDSAGQAWPEVLTAKWSPVTNSVLSVALRLVELGYIDFTVTPDRVVRAWRFGTRGINRAAGARPTTLRRGENLLEAGRRQGSRGAGSRFFVVGGEGAYTTVEDLNAQARLGEVVEVGSSIGNITETGALAAAAQRTAAHGSRGEDERTFALALGVGMPRPGRNLGVGDTVRIDTAGQLGTDRVAQWTVALDAGSQMPTAQVTTGDLIRSRAAALLRRLEGQESGDIVSGTSQPSEDRGVPAAPTGLVVGSQAYHESGVDVYASVTAGWDPALVNTDGTATTDLDRYRVEWRREDQPTFWQLGVEVDAQRTSGSWSVAPALPIRVRVQAIDRTGNRSTWSTEVTHLTEDDADPPAVPSTPLGADWLGTTRWTWDGKTSSGADMIAAHPDFSHVELHMSTTSNFTPDQAAWPTGTLLTNLYAAGTWTVADLPYGVTQFCRLVSVDIRGNRQTTPSAQAQATPGKVVNIDMGPNAIARAQIVDLEVVTAKLDNLAANDAKIGSVSVGKVTAGILSADVVLAGIIRTATSGARGEFDNAGLRLYDSSGAVRVNLAAATGSALITGEYRSALSGRRFVINPLGSSPDELRFYPASTNQYAKIKPVEDGVSTTYQNMAGIGMKAYSPRSDQQSGEVNVFPAYARLAFSNEMGGGAVSSSVGVEKHQAGMAGPRVQIGAQSGTSEGEDSVVRIGVFNNAGTAFAAQATAQWDNGGNYGYGRWWSPGQNCGFQFNQVAMAVINSGNALINIHANAFIATSDRDVKTDIEVLDPLIATAAVLGARTYRYEKHAELGVPRRPGRREVGLMTDELPRDLVHWLEGHDHHGVDVYGAVAVVWAALREQIVRGRQIEREVAGLRERVDGPLGRPLGRGPVPVRTEAA